MTDYSASRYRSYDPAFEDRVVADMKSGSDEDLRLPDMLDEWKNMLAYIISDSETQLAQHKAEMTAKETQFALLRHPAQRDFDSLHSDRLDYAIWRRKNLAFKRGAQRRLAECNNLMQKAHKTA